ncbi:MAG: hypothetical protein K0Q91_422 [Fibrobacteria bacterium]|jgi:hypothetical protein|nr:hypothetical protein [Fibrobacteria bacterium]
MLQAILILIVGLAGIWFTLRHLRKNVRELRARPKGSVKTSDLIFNQGLSFLWFGYLLAFFTGLIVNNLLLK